MSQSLPRTLDQLPPRHREEAMRQLGAGGRAAAATRCPELAIPTEPCDQAARPPRRLRQSTQPKLNKLECVFFKEAGVPCPIFEYRFHGERKWRFDLAWLDQKVALEIQGGIFLQGRHTRGPALIKEWEKLNAAAILGWRILYCQPKDLCTRATAMMVASALYP